MEIKVKKNRVEFSKRKIKDSKLKQEVFAIKLKFLEIK
jgi:hypothetical protein